MKGNVCMAALILFVVQAVSVRGQMVVNIITDDDVEKTEAVDQTVFSVQYQMRFVPDTLKPERTVSETMMLRVGGKSSVYYSYARFLSDKITTLEQIAMKVSRSPSRYIEASYQSVIRYGGSVIGRDTRLSPLWSIVREASVSYLLFPIELNLSASYYHNDVNSNQSAGAFFAHVSFRLKQGGWQFEAFAMNLFNRRQYRYAEYSSLNSYTSRINIRGRELLIAAKYKF